MASSSGDAARRVALIVGIDQYADPLLTQLQCAVSDAVEFGGFLKHRALRKFNFFIYHGKCRLPAADSVLNLFVTIR